MRLIKYFISAIVALTLSLSANAQDVRWEGNTIVSTKTAKTILPPTETPFTYKDSKGKTYKVYISDNGSCFIIKTSTKTGKQYKQYLKTDLSIAICNKLGREYKGKKKS